MVLTWPLYSTEKPLALQVTAHHTQTLTHRGKEGNLVRACVSVIGQAVQFVLFKAPGQRERESERGSGQRDIISSLLGGIQVLAGLMKRGGN